jgi:tripartite-type tricarboxylate transporter receptor subunit TctC
MKRRDFVRLGAVAIAASTFNRSTVAQAYPTRPITMVVPVAAGGALDSNARLVGDGMRAALGQPIIVENVTGAAGSLGTGRIARAAPDGYSILFGAYITHVLNPAVLTLNYDVVADFEPIALIGSTSWLLAVRKDMPVTDLKGLVTWLKENPEKATFGTAGVGSPSHIGGLLFQQATGTRFQFIPYRGTAPVIPDLVSGQIDMAILDPVTSLPQFRSGRIKILAVMGLKRGAGSQDIPTGDEAGVPGIYIDPWQAMWAPKGTPPDIIAKLNDAVVSALSDAEIRKKFLAQSYDLPAREQLTPEFLAQYHKAELTKWLPIIRASGIRIKE